MISASSKPRRRCWCCLAQELVVVRGEVGDQQQAVLSHQPRGLGHGGGGIAQIVQHLVDGDQIGAAARQAGGEDVAMTQLAGGPGPPWPPRRARC
jgi:hypothetical protein